MSDDVVVNPLAALTDDQLWNNQLLLQISCNRVQYAPAKKRVDNLCALGNALKAEAVRRNVQQPGIPFNLSKLRNP
jgi:hypothetical protein